MADPRVVGSGDLTEKPDGVSWDINQSKITATLTQRGSYADCKAAVLGASPAYVPGAIVTGESEFAGMRCDNAKIKKALGDRGELTWAFSVENSAEPPEVPAESEPVYEVEFARIERPLESHPRYVEAKDLQGGALEGVTALTPEQFALVKEYDGAGYDRRKEICDFSATPATGELAANETAVELLTKKLKGVESYVIFPPVVRETTEISGVPDGEGAGVIEDPPEAAAAPSGYAYLSTASRRSSDGPAGAWRRTREWTGAYEWDTDLYPGAAAP